MVYLELQIYLSIFYLSVPPLAKTNLSLTFEAPFNNSVPYFEANLNLNKLAYTFFLTYGCKEDSKLVMNSFHIFFF